jgi:hypothetical protein
MGASRALAKRFAWQNILLLAWPQQGFWYLVWKPSMVN